MCEATKLDALADKMKRVSEPPHYSNQASNKKGMGMTEPKDRIAQEREEITARIARFRATQARFEREREEFFKTTLENARRSNRPSLW